MEKQVEEMSKFEDSVKEMGWQKASSQLTAIARENGRLEVTAQVEQLSQSCSVDEVREYLFEIVCQGADDTWSGRGNDLTRSYFDGVRDGARECWAALNR